MHLAHAWSGNHEVDEEEAVVTETGDH